MIETIIDAKNSDSIDDKLHGLRYASAFFEHQLPGMSVQEVFDVLVEWLSTEKKPKIISAIFDTLAMGYYHPLFETVDMKYFLTYMESVNEPEYLVIFLDMITFRTEDRFLRIVERLCEYQEPKVRCYAREVLKDVLKNRAVKKTDSID